MTLLKTIIIWGLGAVIMVAPAPVLGDPRLPEGFIFPKEATPAPEINLKDKDGNLRRLSDYRGKMVLLHFWACWCQPCESEFPKIKWLSKQFKYNDFVILTVAEDSLKAVREFVKKRDIDLPVLIDQYGSALRSYDIQGLPSSYIIDAEGLIKGIAVGAREWDSPAIFGYISALLDEKRVRAALK